MTEISASIVLSHPIDLVWRALTEPPLLARWFVEADLRPQVGATFRLHAPVDDSGVTGFDATTLAEVKVVEPPHRMVMTWRSEQLHTTVTWTLWPLPEGGCRLDVSQIGFLGVRGTSRREALRATYQRLYGERLPAVLDELAGGPPAVIPPLVPEQPRRSRRTALLAGIAALVVAAAGTTLVLTLRGGAGGPAPGAATDAPFVALTLDPTASSATPLPPPTRSPSARTTRPPRSESPTPRTTEGVNTPHPPRPSASPTPGAPPAASLTAAYRTVSTSLLGYRGSIAVSNTGTATSADIPVVITVAPLAAVTSTTASYTRSGTTITFTLPPLGPGASAEFTFDILLDSGGDNHAPYSCTVATTPCTGI